MSYSDPVRAYYAWRTNVRKRQGTPDFDLDGPVDKLLSEGFGTGYSQGRRDGFSLSAEFRGAVDTIERVADELTRIRLEREAIQLVGEEEMRL